MGAILSGGSEANITALWAIRNNKIARFKAINNPPEVIAPNSVHISIDKAADLLGLSLIKIPTTPQYQMDIPVLENAITKRTIGVVGVAGTTALGTIDPLDKINEICLTNDLDYHIDAAFGGLVFPFLQNSEELFKLSFNLESLSSMTIDIHKMGRVPIPGGGILWRDKIYPAAIKFTLPYLAGSPQQHTISGTRSGASAIAFATLWDQLGFEGFQQIVYKCIKNTQFLSQELKKRGFLFKVKPVINILGVKIPNDFNIDIYTLHEELWKNGWTTTIVDDFLRFVVMPATDRFHLEELLSLIDQILR
jgi:tyrosine decarboxylase/aspartate 1-decarboxylase